MKVIMQIPRTEVNQAITPTGEAILRVIFCGEGSDCVTVDMANVEAGKMRPSIGQGDIGPARYLRACGRQL
ncbi:hypothetical protein [Mesorhizobium sp.]|uniref:hypothetical protein n=1 Tax=Mesorhizobium sp. TaxID=1871066 RepID=UPI000FE98FCE|nr:hypothetical protein [Mesorhizobium sp.]RWC39330.1 MAG: hypothetical protein EOS28_26750 [Mesorhizobium sp.]RWF04493.1 MAG: hypothetical protein EOS68_02475 [Mesorhizobium sp.]